MKPIKLSVLDLVPIMQGFTPGEALQQAVRLAQSAERNGYVRYWAAEHHDIPGIGSTCPEVLLTHIGAMTRSIRIGSGALLLPYYKPLKVAEAFHMLATLYPDRVDLGIGRAPGGSAHASMALSDNFLEQVRRFPESLQQLAELLTSNFRIDGHSVLARPVPPVPPELWLLGTNVKSAQQASRLGAGFAFGYFMSELDGTDLIADYKRDFQFGGLLPHPKVIVAVNAICTETEEEAQMLSKEGATAFLASNERANGEEEGRSSAPIPAEELKSLSSRAARSLVGTPQSIRTRLLKLQEMLQADEWMIVTTIADYDKRIRSYELLSEMIE